MQAEGRAEVVEEPNLGGRWVEITRRMSYRYLGPNGPTYLESTMKQPRWLFRIKPENMKTWHGPRVRRGGPGSSAALIGAIQPSSPPLPSE
jgi:hypothetical protein